jgi:hypothetical protein
MKWRCRSGAGSCNEWPPGGRPGGKAMMRIIETLETYDVIDACNACNYKLDKKASSRVSSTAKTVLLIVWS